MLAQGCKNMLTFLTPESPDFQSFLFTAGAFNENAGTFQQKCHNLWCFEAHMDKFCKRDSFI